MTTRILTGDCRELLKTLPDASVQCCVTSPPYFGLRDYGMAGQIGLEMTYATYVGELVRVFDEVRRVLRDDGTLWLNLGDSYAGSWGAQGRQGDSGQMAGRSVVQARSIAAHPQKMAQTGSLRGTPGLKQKDLIGIPWRVAFALLSDNCSKEVGMTKTQALIKLARARWVTVQVSLRCIGLASLSQRVTELEREHGMKFDRRWITGNGSRCLAYRLRSDRPDICA